MPATSPKVCWKLRDFENLMENWIFWRLNSESHRATEVKFGPTLRFKYCRWYIIAGLPISKTHTKNQFADQPEGLRHFRDHRWKALGKKNSDLSGRFL